MRRDAPSPSRVDLFMKRTLSLSYGSYGAATNTAANLSEQPGELELPKDDRVDELARPNALKNSVGFGRSESADEPPTIRRPPSKAESSSAKTEAGQRSMWQAPPAVYITEHDESPPPRRGIARLSQAVTTVKLMNKAQHGTLNPAEEAFLNSRALSRMIGVKGTDHQGLQNAGEMDGSKFSCEPHASNTRASSPSPLSLILTLATRYVRELFRLARLGKAVELRAILGELGHGHAVLQTRDYSGRSLVLTAAREGNVASVLVLLEFGCDPSTPNSQGWTPLAFAARGAPKKESQPESWLQLAEALLRAKADTAATTSKGFQPLHYACASNHAAAVRVLLQRGANPSAATAEGITALHVACFLGLPECVELLCISRPELVQQCDKGGRTPLHYAAVRGMRKPPSKLLNKLLVPKPAFADGMHLTKLHALADLQCHLQSDAAHLAAALTILKLLFGAGADALASQRETRVTPLHLAVGLGTPTRPKPPPSRLQPRVVQAATPCSAGCNPVCSRPQSQRAPGCNPTCHRPRRGGAGPTGPRPQQPAHPHRRRAQCQLAEAARPDPPHEPQPREISQRFGTRSARQHVDARVSGNGRALARLGEQTAGRADARVVPHAPRVHSAHGRATERDPRWRLPPHGRGGGGPAGPHAAAPRHDKPSPARGPRGRPQLQEKTIGQWLRAAPLA